MEITLQTHILLIVDDYAKGLAAAEELVRRSYCVTICTSTERALTCIEQGDVDVVLTEDELQDMWTADLDAAIS